MATAASTGYRVIYHEPICPQCGSFNTTTDDIETTDGLRTCASDLHRPHCR